MHMWFWIGNNLGSFLFPGYNVTTVTSFLCTCLGLTALAILYEGMKILQIKIQRTATILVQRQTAQTSENSSLLSKISSRSIGARYSLRCVRWSTWSIQVLHWFIHTFIGYLLMLAVMTYNVYVNIALVLGGCIGYWVFGPKLVENKLARFHEKQRLLQCDKECAEIVDSIVNHQRPGTNVSIIADQLVTEATIEVHTPRSD